MKKTDKVKENCCDGEVNDRNENHTALQVYDSPVEDEELLNSEIAEKYAQSGDDKIADKDYQGAIEDLSEAIRLDPQNARYYSLRGVAYYELGRYDETLQDEERSIEIRPTSYTLYNRAESYYKMGRDREALADLDHAIRMIKNDPRDFSDIQMCHELIAIIKDKSLKREDYYQAPVGWENKGKNRQIENPQDEAYDDVGPEALSFVYKSLRIDAEWAVVEPTGFAWWGHQLAQRIWADKCRRDLGTDVTLLHAETDFLRNVEDNQDTYEAINTLNTAISQYAFIYDPEERSIKLHASVYIHRQNLGWSRRLFLRAAGLQVSYAHRKVESSSHLFKGSEPDTSPHPENGFRQEEDEIVTVVDTYSSIMQELPLDSGTFKFMTDSLSPLFMVSTGADAVSAEFPFSGDEPSAVRPAQGNKGAVTSLFIVNSDGVHPLLGRGLLLRLILPVTYGREGNLQVAAAFNLMEAGEWARCHLNGAWYVDDRSQLVFISFLPLSESISGELANLAFSFVRRNVWAYGVLGQAEADNARLTNQMLH